MVGWRAMTGRWRWRISGAWRGDWRIGGYGEGGRDREKKQREEKEKEKEKKKENCTYLVKRKEKKTEGRRNGIGAGLPQLLFLIVIL